MADLREHLALGDVIQHRYHIQKALKDKNGEWLYVGLDTLLRMHVKIRVFENPDAGNGDMLNRFMDEDILHHYHEDGVDYLIFPLQDKDGDYIYLPGTKGFSRLLMGAGCFVAILFVALLFIANKRSIQTYSLSENGVNLSQETVWKNVSEEHNKGKYQCNEDSLTGQLVTVTLKSYEELSEGKWIDAMDILKSRLDMLEQPYAVGFLEKARTSTFVFKTGIGHMGKPVIDLLTSTGDRFRLQTSLFLSSHYNIGDNPDCALSGNGGNGIQIEMREEELDKLQLFTEKVLEGGGRRIFFAFDGKPFLYTDIDKAVSDGKLTFDSMAFENGGKITNQDAWLVNLAAAIWNGSNLNLEYSDMQFNADDRGDIPGEEQLGVIYEGERVMKERILSVMPDAQVMIEKEVKVSLHLELDDTFPEKSVMLTKEIYQNSGFEDSFYTHMLFFLADEQGDERARIYFQKNFDEGEWKLRIGGIFGNGRFDAYQDEFKELISQDSFYVRTPEDKREWAYDFTFH